MAEVLVTSLYLYLAIGFLFALWFVVRGVNNVDSGMRESPRGVRLLIFPGSALLWPILLRKCLVER